MRMAQKLIRVVGSIYMIKKEIFWSGGVASVAGIFSAKTNRPLPISVGRGEQKSQGLVRTALNPVEQLFQLIQRIAGIDSKTLHAWQGVTAAGVAEVE